jgi:phage/plasmid-associated DNA primase
MWRRLRPIPLTNIPENPDKDLRPYLSDPEGGLPAVLSWAVDGAIKYLNSSAKDALGWCTIVREAADVYRKNEDRIGLFFEEETQQAKDISVTIASLYGLYRKWSDTRGERAMTQIAFQRKLSDRAMNIVGQGSKAVLHGYAILPRAVPNWTDSVAASQIML